MIEFTSGRRYSYLDVPPETAAQFHASLSKGEFFNTDIRDHYSFIRES